MAHGHAHRAVAAQPTLSLLRMSASARLVGASVLALGLWALVLLVIG